MAGGAAELPKWQTNVSNVCISRSYRLTIMTVSQPEWQIARENCQNGRCSKSHARANTVPQKIIFLPIFFI